MFSLFKRKSHPESESIVMLMDNWELSEEEQLLDQNRRVHLQEA